MRFLFYLSILAPTAFSSMLSDPTARDTDVTQPEALGQSRRLENRDADTTYMAWAADPQNENDIAETRKFLNETVVDKNQYINVFKARDGSSYLWGGLTLDDAALEKVQAYSKIKKVMVEPEVEEDLAISREDEGFIPV
jgi:hypothetical protein